MDPALRRSSFTAGAGAAAAKDARPSPLSPASTKPAGASAGSTTAGQRKNNALAFFAAGAAAVVAALLLVSGGGAGAHIFPSSSAGRTSANLRGIGGDNGGGFGDGDDRATLHPRPLVIAGPSGVGKGTLIGMLLDHYNSAEAAASAANSNGTSTSSLAASSPSAKKNYFGLSVSHTTRGPRPGEAEGVHYHFTTREQLQEGIDKGDFVEWNEVHGNLYGTSYASIRSVSSSGLIPVIEVDVQGVKRIKAQSASSSSSSSSRLDPPPLYLFIAPPSLETLEARLRGRATETEEAIRTRLGNAAREIEYGRGEGNFDRVLVHEDVSTSFPELVRIVEGWYPHLKGVKGKVAGTKVIRGEKTSAEASK